MKPVVLGPYLNSLGFIKKLVVYIIDFLLVSDQETYSGSRNTDKQEDNSRSLI
jgi:hypothetical protein